MLLILLTVCFLSVVSQSQGQFAGRGACPPATPLTNVDPNRIKGLWYAAKRIDNDLERNHVCSKIFFTLNPNNTFILDISGIIQPNGVDFSWRALGVPVAQSTVGVYQTVNPKYAAAAGQRIILLDTDYDNYAVFTSCDAVNGAHFQYGWILSRTPTQSKYVDDALRVLDRNNIPAAETISVPQRHCPK